MYRAWTPVHCDLIEGLTNNEGDVGRTDTGGGLDGQTLSLLGDFHCWAGGRYHCNLPQENIHTCMQNMSHIVSYFQDLQKIIGFSSFTIELNGTEYNYDI